MSCLIFPCGWNHRRAYCHIWFIGCIVLLYLYYRVDFPKALRQGRWHSQVCQPAVTKVMDGLMERSAPPFFKASCRFPCMPWIADSLHLPLTSNMFYRVLKKLGSQECSLPHNSRVSLVSGLPPSLPMSRAVYVTEQSFMQHQN